MNTIFNPKKVLFIAIFLALATFTGAPRVEAQVTSQELQTQLDALNQSLIALLTQMIADLQAQIATLVAQQATQATQLGAVESKVDTIQTQTAPVLGSQIGEVEEVRVYPDPSTLTPASLGNVFQSGEEQYTHDKSGEVKNIIPLNFNDAYLVHLNVYCPSRGSRGSADAAISYELRATSYTGTAHFTRELGIGQCEYSLQSRDPLERRIGEPEYGTFTAN